MGPIFKTLRVGSDTNGVNWSTYLGIGVDFCIGISFAAVSPIRKVGSKFATSVWGLIDKKHHVFSK